ncbi:hypothetical protein SRHO_G00199090 [Serrasalmus rhombeus]
MSCEHSADNLKALRRQVLRSTDSVKLLNSRLQGKFPAEARVLFEHTVQGESLHRPWHNKPLRWRKGGISMDQLAKRWSESVGGAPLFGAPVGCCRAPLFIPASRPDCVSKRPFALPGAGVVTAAAM